MKKTSILLLVSVLTLTLLAFAYVTAQAETGSDENAVSLLQATSTLQVPATPGAQEETQQDTTQGTQIASLVELWDQFCIRKIPYTLLALPENATFELIQPESPLPTPNPVFSANSNEISCTNVGIFRGQQVVVCRGPNNYSFSLQVSDGGAAEEFVVPLKACFDLNPPAPEVEATPVP